MMWEPSQMHVCLVGSLKQLTVTVILQEPILASRVGLHQEWIWLARLPSYQIAPPLWYNIITKEALVCMRHKSC